MIDFSDTESNLPSQSGHSSGGEDHSSASPTTPRADRPYTSAMRQKSRALNLGPSLINGNAIGNGNGNGNGYHTQGNGDDGLPASPHLVEGIAK